MLIQDIIDIKTLSYKWDVIENIPEFAKLKECEQSVKWHSEGNAWEHTKLVCAEAIKICKDYRQQNTFWAKYLLTAALFHDIGKGTTTIFKKDDWHSYGHELSSEKLTRKLLWDEGYVDREAICGLVRLHMEPLFIFTHKTYYDRIIDISNNVVSWDLLINLKKCDILGSKPSDVDRTYYDLTILEDLTTILSKLKCYYSRPNLPYSRQLRHKLFNNKKTINVHVLIGIPGSGKSTTVKKIVKTFNGPYCIVSRDIARYELGYCSEGEKMLGTDHQEKMVTEKCNDMILTAAELGETIIIDNTNLKRKYRDSYRSMLSDYNVVITYHYVEARTLKVNLERRDGQISREVFDNMIMGFEWPQADEYDYIKFHLT
jgi:putative nucleotidyltransferase with HDIG domain